MTKIFENNLSSFLEHFLKNSHIFLINIFYNRAKANKYGFAEKVVDGMYVSINTLTASFTSLGFKATVNISRIIVQSTTPEWRQANNLRQTRIKDEEKGEVINFKEIRWGTMRVHADAAYKAEVSLNWEFEKNSFFSKVL